MEKAIGHENNLDDLYVETDNILKRLARKV